MKICHVTSVHGPFDGRIFHKMACSAVKAGHAVTLIAPHSTKEVREGVTIIPIKKPTNRVERFYRALKLQGVLYNVDADIYHFHDPELIPAMLRFHKKTGKKVIYDVHEFYKEVILAKTWIPEFLRKIIAIITWRMELAACQSFECTIAATEELAKVYEPYAYRSEFILNFDFKKEIEFIHSDRESDIDIIHVGTLSSGRLDFLLTIAEKLRERGNYFRWYFIGVPEELSKSKLSKIKQEHQRYISMLGKVPFEEVKQFYQRARIGISYHPLEKRFLVAIPMKIFEYMKHGLTVVTSDLPPIRRFITNGVNGAIVYENTVEAFANEIERIMGQEKFAETAVVNKTAILERFNWESEAERLMRIYETL